MLKLYVIGTIHNIISQREITQILNKYLPDQVFIEISPKDLKRRKFAEYPKEMIFAFNWATRKKIQVIGFDSNIVYMKKISKQKLRKINKEEMKRTKNHNWKEQNKSKYDHELDDLLYQAINKLKFKRRQKEMLKNINKSSIKKGKALILTGAGHLEFFENNLKNATFPFRT